MKITIPCHCGHRFDYEYEEDVEITPAVFDQILSGKFMNVVCEKCGITLKPEYPVLFRCPEKNMTIFLVPELQRDSFLRGKSPLENRKTDRFVIGFIELAEKLKILKSGLDDITTEAVKYYILSKIENETENENEISIVFDKIENSKLIFYITGLKENQTGVLNIDKSFYDMTSNKLKEVKDQEPFKNFLTPPYISILKIYREYTDIVSSVANPESI